MSKHRAVLITALMLLGALLFSASASAITISPGGTITSSGTLTFNSDLFTTTCDVTLTQSVTAGTYSAGQTYGRLTGAAAANCDAGTVTIGGVNSPLIMGPLNGTMMHKLVVIDVLIDLGGIRCLWRGRVGADYDGRVLVIDPVLGLALDPTQWLVDPLCALIGDLSITGALVLSPTVTVTLP